MSATLAPRPLPSRSIVPPGSDAPLTRRLTWLMGLRLLVLTIFLVLITTFYLRGLSLGSYSGWFSVGTVGTAYFLAAVYAIALRAGRGLRMLARLQLVTDQLVWTAMVYISGGATSGATSLYGLTCLSGAILLGGQGGVVALLSGVTAYVCLSGAFALHLVLPPPDQLVDLYVTRWSDMGFPVVVNLLGLAVVTLLASYLAERLRVTGGHLEEANQRAEQAERLALLGRLAAGLAHEIRNPLGSIAGSIELLRTGGTLGEEDRALCEIVERETARLNELVSDMLDLSRPRAPVQTNVDLAVIARDLVHLAAKSGRGADVRAVYEGPAAAHVLADAAQMRQVVWNLMRNAIQASAPGDEVIVRVCDAPSGERLLEVEDHGAGIDPEAKARLFDAFFTTRTQGMGIGLAVVKRIVDDHGFTVDVESEGGKGTTFRIRIPEKNILEPIDTSRTSALPASS
ncbi:Two-component sensor PilS [Minicystis rosea]|nr:Two-component sensor PilS [Minicystis rosea]